MATLQVDEALGRVTEYPHLVLSYVGDDGYPVSVAAEFNVGRGGAIDVGPLSRRMLPASGQEVVCTFSHIRPIEGVGYDQRRYVCVWGAASAHGGGLRVRPTRAAGWDEVETPFFEYCERGVPRGRAYMDQLGARPRLGLGWLFLLATRLPFTTATVVPVAIGGAVAALHGAFSWGVFGLTMLAAIAVHLGLNIANDVFDDLSGADVANVTPTPFSGGSRVIQRGLLSRRAMVLLGAGMYALAIGIGVYLAETRGRGLYVIGAVGIAISIFYTSPPFRLVHRGLGEVAVALGFGPVMTLGAYYALVGEYDWEPVYASLPIALLIALVLYVNEIPDRAGDAAVGKRTLPVRWPKQRVIAGFDASAAAAYALVVAGVLSGLMPPWAALGLATIPMALKVHRGLRDHYDRPYQLMASMQTNIGLHLFTGLLLLAGYLIELAFR